MPFITSDQIQKPLTKITDWLTDFKMYVVFTALNTSGPEFNETIFVDKVLWLIDLVCLCWNELLIPVLVVARNKIVPRFQLKYGLFAFIAIMLPIK